MKKIKTKKETKPPRSERPVRPSLIKDSKTIRDFLAQRLRDMNIDQIEVVRDAKKYNAKIERGALSKFLNYGNVQGTLAEESIIWLCARYDVPLKLIVGTPMIQDNKLKIVLQPFDEKRAMATLRTLFGDGQ